jgi:hypothetical protein
MAEGGHVHWYFQDSVFIALRYFPQSSDVGKSRFVNFTAENAIFAFQAPNRKSQLFDIYCINNSQALYKA